MTITAIWWARRDLRLRDNHALQAALAEADRVVPAFVLDPLLLNSPDTGAKRVAFMLAELRALDADLRRRGSRLVVRRGDPQRELALLLAECQATALFAEGDPWPYAQDRDRQVAESLPLHLMGGGTLHPPDAILKADGQPYRAFTPFSRRWRDLPLPDCGSVVPAPEEMAPPPELPRLAIPDALALPQQVPFAAGEAEAQGRLSDFARGRAPRIYGYQQGRDRLDEDGTSRLSPYLRFGMLSNREAVAVAREALDAAPDRRSRAGADTWIGELIWREFFQSVLHHFPNVLEQSFRAPYRSIRWANDEAALTAWQEGHTGYPVVDAAMRQLAQTGWMHNRARMIVGSFLTKDLLVDCRFGEAHFMQHLPDGDPAANNGGWQWVAGTGTDAAPYFRIFNPVLQGKKHDSRGRTVRRWVPELANVPDRFIHEPWKMPAKDQESADCIIGHDYPAPIVDHRWARQRALAAHSEARDRARGRPACIAHPPPASVMAESEKMVSSKRC